MIGGRCSRFCIKKSRYGKSQDVIKRIKRDTDDRGWGWGRRLRHAPAADVGLDVPVDFVVDVLALIIVVIAVPFTIGKVVVVQNGCSETSAGSFLSHGGVVEGKLFLWDI
jgi:hypothetical protein